MIKIDFKKVKLAISSFFKDKRVAKYLFPSFAVVAVFFAVFGGVGAASLMHKPIVSNEDNPVVTAVDVPVVEGDAASSFGGRVNILMMGTDEDYWMRSDTMMLFSVNLSTKEVDILSIPRDTKVSIGGHAQKINAAIGIGKEDLSIRTVKTILGLPINYYVTINTKGFRQIIDALGGVDFDVPMRMYYEDDSQHLLINLQKGMQHLDGAKAEQFVRFRHGYVDGDQGRIDAQQKFMKALFQQKAQPQYILAVNNILQAVNQNVHTNITAADIAKYLPVMLQIKPENVTMHELPGEFRYMDQLWYYVHDEKQTIKLAQDFFGLKLLK